MQDLMKESASKAKMEWIYVNRLVLTIVTFICSIIFFIILHKVAINYVYTNPTTRQEVLGSLSEKNQKAAEELTKQDNYFLDKLKGNLKITQAQVENAMVNSVYYEADDENLEDDAARIMDKLKVVNSEQMQWFEILLACGFSLIAYMAPKCKSISVFFLFDEV